MLVKEGEEKWSRAEQAWKHNMGGLAGVLVRSHSLFDVLSRSLCLTVCDGRKFKQEAARLAYSQTQTCIHY